MTYELVVTTGFLVIGTDDTITGVPGIYRKSGTWSEIASAFMPTAQTAVVDIIGIDDLFYFGTLGAGSTYVVGSCQDSGGSPTDYSADIGTACDGITAQRCFCLYYDGNVLYAAVEGVSTTGQNYIVKSEDAGATWTKVLKTGIR